MTDEADEAITEEGQLMFENEIGRLAETSKENEPEGEAELDDTNAEGLLFDDDAGRVSNFAAADELDEESGGRSRPPSNPQGVAAGRRRAQDVRRAQGQRRILRALLTREEVLRQPRQS